jgi:ribonuclease-3
MPSTTWSGASADPVQPITGPDALVARLGHRFTDPGLLEQAFHHRSWCAERGVASNERLEFLGDSVLGLAVTDYVYSTYPELPEGMLAKIRSAVVSSVSLAAVAAELDLGSHLLLGRGEEATGGRTKQSILADAVEAVIGAVFVDAGWDAARSVVLGLVQHRITVAAAGPGEGDYKNRLQELLAQRGDGSLRYTMTEDGPDHDKRFVAAVVIDGDEVATGAGKSKKLAQQDAARAALERLTPADHLGGREGGGPEPVGGTDVDARAT